MELGIIPLVGTGTKRVPMRAVMTILGKEWTPSLVSQEAGYYVNNKGKRCEHSGHVDETEMSGITQGDFENMIKRVVEFMPSFDEMVALGDEPVLFTLPTGFRKVGIKHFIAQAKKANKESGVPVYVYTDVFAFADGLASFVMYNPFRVELSQSASGTPKNGARLVEGSDRVYWQYADEAEERAFVQKQQAIHLPQPVVANEAIVTMESAEIEVESQHEATTDGVVQKLLEIIAKHRLSEAVFRELVEMAISAKKGNGATSQPLGVDSIDELVRNRIGSSGNRFDLTVYSDFETVQSWHRQALAKHKNWFVVYQDQGEGAYRLTGHRRDAWNVVEHDEQHGSSNGGIVIIVGTKRFLVTAAA